MFSLSEENYLKAIFHLEKKFPTGVSTNALAEEMEAKASSVTDMVKRLSEKNLVEYKKYQGVTLKKKGKDTALGIIRKHRLWEVFLVEKLRFSWDEVHEVAEQLEHIKSDKLIDELDRYLGYPTRDPHGDPIPDGEGKFTVFNKHLLGELCPGETGIFTGVKDSSVEFLQYLDKNKLAIGEELLVLEKEEYDQSMLISLQGSTLRISSRISMNVYINKV